MASGSRASTPGDRAVGNLRQPNHQSSLLLWSMIARCGWPRAPAAGGRVVAGAAAAAAGGRGADGLAPAWSAPVAGAVGGGSGVESRASVACSLLNAPVAYLMFFTSRLPPSRITTRCSPAKFSCRSPTRRACVGIWANTLTPDRSNPWAGGLRRVQLRPALHAFPAARWSFRSHPQPAAAVRVSNSACRWRRWCWHCCCSSGCGAPGAWRARGGRDGVIRAALAPGADDGALHSPAETRCGVALLAAGGVRLAALGGPAASSATHAPPPRVNLPKPPRS